MISIPIGLLPPLNSWPNPKEGTSIFRTKASSGDGNTSTNRPSRNEGFTPHDAKNFMSLHRTTLWAMLLAASAAVVLPFAYHLARQQAETRKRLHYLSMLEDGSSELVMTSDTRISRMRRNALPLFGNEVRLLRDAGAVLPWDSLHIGFSYPLQCDDIHQLSGIENIHGLALPSIAPDVAECLDILPNLQEVYVSGRSPPHNCSIWSNTGIVSRLKSLGVPGAIHVDLLVAKLNEAPATIRWLDLSGSDITDTDLANISRLKNLEELCLDDTSVSLAGIQLLSSSRSLRYVTAHRTPAALEDLPPSLGISFELTLE